MISPKFNKKSSGAHTATGGGGKKSSGYSMFGGFMNQKKDKTSGKNDVELSDSRDFNRAMSEYCSQEETKDSRQQFGVKTRAMTMRNGSGNMQDAK